MTRTSRPSRWMILSSLAALVLGGIGWRLWDGMRLARAIAAAREEIQETRYATARRDLERLVARHPDSAEASYLLGLCERNLGRTEAAAGSWSRVPTASTFGSRAVQGRMELEVERGRLAEAERIIEQAAADPGADATGLRLYLGQIDSQEGRASEAEEIIEARWEYLRSQGDATTESAINLLRLSTELRNNPMPVEDLRRFLDQMARLAPDDDRVRLGQARLAIRTGAYEEAARMLRDCERDRPGDFAVGHARLDLAVAMEDVAEAFQEFEKLPADRLPVGEVGRFAAWLFRKPGSREQERRAVEVFLQAVPTDAIAWKRLGEMASAENEIARVDALRRARDEIESMQARFLFLHRRNQPLRDAAELGRLASRLGYWLEARGYLTLAIEADPDRAESREELRSLETRLNELESRRELLTAEILAAAGRRHRAAGTPTQRPAGTPPD